MPLLSQPQWNDLWEGLESIRGLTDHLSTTGDALKAVFGDCPAAKAIQQTDDQVFAITNRLHAILREAASVASSTPAVE